MDLLLVADRLETTDLKPPSEHFPIAHSLRSAVLETCREPMAEHGGSSVMGLEQVLGYLKTTATTGLPPLAAIRDAARAAGDTTQLAPDHAAVLRWVEAAFSLLKRSAQLEEPLSSSVQRLMPVSAYAALTEPHFLQPDQHPLHRMLDSVLARAVGWQASLGRAGLTLRQQVSEVVDKCLAQVGNGAGEIAAACEECIAALSRDESRSVLMAGRVAEADQGRLRASEARREAARVINSALEEFIAPPEIGSFITGPWYHSAQLVLLRFGANSRQWHKMSSVTTALLESVQNLDTDDNERRLQLFDLISQMPREIRRWLLSLHHDTGAVNEAMDMIESIHVQVLRHKALAAEAITPIAVEETGAAAPDPKLGELLQGLVEGRWFRIRQGDGDVLRARLSLKDEQRQRLVFTNLVGIKALEVSFAQFAALARGKHVVLLQRDNLFSRSLCAAAARQPESSPPPAPATND